LVAQIASVGRLTGRQLADKQKYNKRLRADDLKYLRATTGEEVLYSPYQQRVEDVKAESQTYEAANVIGVSADMPQIRDIPVATGRFFIPIEEQRRVPVAVIGDDIRSTLFEGRDPIGAHIKVSGIDLTVVGILERQGSSFGQSLDNPVYIPSTLYQSLFGGNANMVLFGRARPGTGLGMDEALDSTRAALRARFHTRPGKPDNFDNLTPDSVRSFTGQILSVIAAVVVPVTSISLLVGGIVIMNIMLVSVTERTREIGIRKSLGARKTDIMLQFLTESLMLSLAGGALGVMAGASAAFVIGKLADATLAITAPYVLLSIFVSSAVGIISGWYPARKAASLDPVEALRAE
jgi:putative ABC transport system permease protein